MEENFTSKILVFVTAIKHNYNSFFCLLQIFHILPNISGGFILPSQIRFFEKAFWVRQKFLPIYPLLGANGLDMVWILPIYPLLPI